MKPDNPMTHQPDPKLEAMLDQLLAPQAAPPGLVERTVAASLPHLATRRRPRWYWLAPVSGIAAAILLAVGAGLMLHDGPDPSVTQPWFAQAQASAAAELAVLARYQSASQLDSEIQYLSAQLELAMANPLWDPEWMGVEPGADDLDLLMDSRF